MTHDDIRNWADALEREGRSSTATLLRALADVVEAAKITRGVCDLSDWHALDDALARVAALKP